MDLCPSGHLAFAVATAVALALPGAALAISEFAHLRGFRFGGVMGGGTARGRGMNTYLKYALLPIYAAVMAPLAIVATIVQ